MYRVRPRPVEMFRWRGGTPHKEAALIVPVTMPARVNRVSQQVLRLVPARVRVRPLLRLLVLLKVHLRARLKVRIRALDPKQVHRRVPPLVTKALETLPALGSDIWVLSRYGKVSIS